MSMAVKALYTESVPTSVPASKPSRTVSIESKTSRLATFHYENLIIRAEMFGVAFFTPAVSNTVTAVPPVTQCGVLYSRDDWCINASVRDSLVMVRAVTTEGCRRLFFSVPFQLYRAGSFL